MGEWAEVEADVRSAGVDDAAGCCGSARRRGATLDQVREAVAGWRSQSGVGAGVLHRRIAGLAWSHGDPRRPDGSPLAAGRRSQNLGATRHAEVVEQLGEARATFDDEARRLAELEGRHGPTIDEADEPEMEKLLAAAGRACVVPLLKRHGRRSGLVRGELLEAWEQAFQILDL